MLEKVKSIATTTLSVVALTSLVFTSVMFLARPWTQPYLEIPSRLLAIENSIENNTRPQLLEFQGRGIILGDDPYERGEVVSVLYSLKRVASCDTMIEIRLYNVETGVYYTVDRRETRKAPVTDIFINFKITFTIPNNIPDGEYTYHPTFDPLDCGVYDYFTPPHTDTFKVR